METYAMVPATLYPSYTEKNVDVLYSCGVFSSAVYFENKKRDIFLLHDSKYSLLPFGFGVPNLPEILPTLEVETGDLVRWESGCLLFKNGMSLCLRTVPIPEFKKMDNRKCLYEKLPAAIKFVKESGRSAIAELITCTEKEEIDGLFARKAFDPLRRLYRGLAEHETGDIECALSKLIGLGPGLTPSLDDFITASLCSFHFAERNWGVPFVGAKKMARYILNMKPETTGKYSGTYLRAAADGARYPIVEKVLNSLSKETIQQLMAVGGHSGGDMAAGVLWTVKWMKENE